MITAFLLSTGAMFLQRWPPLKINTNILRNIPSLHHYYCHSPVLLTQSALPMFTFHRLELDWSKTWICGYTQWVYTCRISTKITDIFWNIQLLRRIYFSAWDHLFRWEGSMSPVKCKLNSHWADKTDHHCRYDPGTLSNTVSVPAHSELVNIPCPDCPVSRCCRPLGCGHGGHRGLERRLLHTGPSHGDHEVRGPQWPVDRRRGHLGGVGWAVIIVVSKLHYSIHKIVSLIWYYTTHLYTLHCTNITTHRQPQVWATELIYGHCHDRVSRQWARLRPQLTLLLVSARVRVLLWTACCCCLCLLWLDQLTARITPPRPAAARHNTTDEWGAFLCLNFSSSFVSERAVTPGQPYLIFHKTTFALKEAF